MTAGTEVREDREVERFQERKRGNRRGQRCLSEGTEALRGCGEAEGTNEVTVNKRLETAAGHTQGNQLRCPRGAQIFSLIGNMPHVGHHKVLPTSVVGLLHQ